MRVAKCAVTIVLSLTLVACHGRKAIPVGEIPLVEKPIAAESQSTSLSYGQKAELKGDRILKSGKEYQRVRGILDRLTDALDTSRDTWPLLVIDGSDTINAFAVNKNTIVVYTGLIRKLKNDDELAAVLGHEISHILAKHGKDENRQSKATATAVVGRIAGYAAAFGAAYAGTGVDVANMAGSIAESGTRTVGKGAILSYDRDQEYEADHVGMMIMAKAGYDPKGAIKVWQNADEVFDGGNKFGFLKTHPSDEKRVEALEKALPKAQEYLSKEAQK